MEAAADSAGGGFGGGGSAGSGGFRRGADVPTLQAVARQTGGTYHGAADADQLRKVFADLPRDVATQKQQSEITWILAALGALSRRSGARCSDPLEPVPVMRTHRSLPGLQCST